MIAPGIVMPSVPSTASATPTSTTSTAVTQLLLFSGILAALLHTAMNWFIPMLWPGYDLASRVVSELSAVDAPTRDIWVVLGVAWAVLMTAFGLGIWMSARDNRPLRRVGIVTFIYGAFNLLPWPPMHPREVLAAGGATLTDTLHIVWSVIAVALMALTLAFGAAALGQRFRAYSIATMAVLLAFGALTFVDAPGVSANLPTPMIGVWERVNIAVYTIWIVVLAVLLLRRPLAVSRGSHP